jgi:predicted  nucleic acid-binding Zn-ribbon protein
MFKNVIAPIQAWLMSQGKCVGCGMPLSQASSKKHKYGEMVTCKCGRIYIKNSKNKTYRRALISEV